MAKYILCISVFLLLKSSCVCQSYGLMFNSHEMVLEKRTSLDLSPNDSFCLAKNFELSFEFSFLRNYATYFGYVLRVVSNKNENIDLIYNQPSSTFKIISGENFSTISFKLIGKSLSLVDESLPFAFNTISTLSSGFVTVSSKYSLMS